MELLMMLNIARGTSAKDVGLPITAGDKERVSDTEVHISCIYFL
jgi:hypothetical protein